jgi:hypothetical protein
MAADAAGDAADQAAGSSREARQQMMDAAEKARDDAFSFFPSAQRDLMAGASGAFDIFGQGITEQQRLLSGGNLNAQQTVSSGFDQTRNALLGLPVNQSSFQPMGLQASQLPQSPFAQQTTPSQQTTPAQIAQGQNVGLVDGVAIGDGYVTAPGLAPLQGSFSNLSNQTTQREFERTAAGERDIDALVAKANKPIIDRRIVGHGKNRAQEEDRAAAIELLASLGFRPDGTPLR